MKNFQIKHKKERERKINSQSKQVRGLNPMQNAICIIDDLNLF